MFIADNGKKIYFVERKAPYKCLKYENIEICYHRAIQVKNSLYAISLGEYKKIFHCYTQNMPNR